MTAKYAILVPAGPRDNLVDTLNSIIFYEPNVLIFVILDYEVNLSLPSNVIVFPPLPWDRNTYGGLLQKKLWAFDYIIRNTQAEIVLTMDADSLMLRSGVFEEVEKKFHDNSLGAAGAYRLDPSGNFRNFHPIARSIVFRVVSSSLRLKRGALVLIRMLLMGKSKEYELGEHPLGCSVFFNRSMLEKWQSLGWLSPQGLETIQVADDGILGLMIKASGYKIAEIGGAGQLLQVAWRGLPTSPQEIVASRAYLTHSVRYFQKLTEENIRSYFANLRH